MRFFARSRRAVAREGTARRGRAHSVVTLAALQGHIRYLAPDDRYEIPDWTRTALEERAATRRIGVVNMVLAVAVVIAGVMAWAQMAGGVP